MGALKDSVEVADNTGFFQLRRTEVYGEIELSIAHRSLIHENNIIRIKKK